MLPRRARWLRPDQNGRFILSGLPAGDYLAIAVAEVDDTVWSTAAYLDRFRAAATPITLAGGERTSIALHASEGR
jgi:hypothetical protein